MPALVRAPLPSQAGQSSSTSSISTTGAITSASWHPQATTGHQWSPHMPFPLPSASQSSSRSAQMSISIVPVSEISTQSSHQPSSTATNGFPQISAGDTANMLFDQLTLLMPLFEAWLQDEVGSTGAVTDAIKIARDTALLTAYQSGGFMANSLACDASLMDTASCIVRSLVKAEEDLSKNSNGDVVNITKKMEKYQRSLLKLIGAVVSQQTSIVAQMTASMDQSVATISITSTVSGSLSVTSGSANVLASPLASTSAGTQSIGNPRSSTALPTSANAKTSVAQTSANPDSSSLPPTQTHLGSASNTVIPSTSSSTGSPAGTDRPAPINRLLQ